MALYRQPKILFPNEHGAWGMFFTAFLLGWLGAPELSGRPLILLPAALGLFLTRYPIGRRELKLSSIFLIVLIVVIRLFHVLAS